MKALLMVSAMIFVAGEAYSAYECRARGNKGGEYYAFGSRAGAYKKAKDQCLADGNDWCTVHCMKDFSK